MAETGFKHGSMDISQHQEMWASFITLSKWSTGVIIAILALMAIFLT